MVEYPLRTKAVLREYPLFFKVKIYSGTDNFHTTLRQGERYIIHIIVPPSSIDSDQVKDCKIHKTKKKINFISAGKRETTSGLRFPTLQKTLPPVVWSCGLVTSTNR